MTIQKLVLNRLSDLYVTVTLDDDGALIDMTGWTVQITDVMPAILAPALAITITTPSIGEMLVSLPWSEDWPKGIGTQVRIRWKLSGLPEAMPELIVVLQ